MAALLVAMVLTAGGISGGWVAHPAPRPPRMKITMGAWR